MTPSPETQTSRHAQRRLRQDYQRLKDETLRTVAAKLRARSLAVPDADLEGYYNQAWHALYDQLAAGVAIGSTVGFLVEVAYRRALDDMRRERPETLGDLDAAQQPFEEDVIARLDDRRRLREFVEGLRSELGERERIAASLCYVHGHTRAQAAELMGLRPSRMKKVMDEVSKTIGRLTAEIDAGARCDARASSTKAYALGLLDRDGERYLAVRAHLDDCAACRVDVLRMRGLAVVAPPPLLPWALVAGGSGAVAGGGAAGRRRRPRRPSNSALVAGAAATAVAVGGLALARQGSEEPRRAPSPSANRAAVPAKPQAASASVAALDRESRTKARAQRKADRAAARRAVATAAARRPASPTVTPPAADPRPAAEAVPAAAAVPTVAPEPAAPAPSPSRTPTAPDESGTQEFGVER